MSVFEPGLTRASFDSEEYVQGSFQESRLESTDEIQVPVELVPNVALMKVLPCRVLFRKPRTRGPR